MDYWTGVDCRREHILTTYWNRGRTTDYRADVGYRLEEMLTADRNTFSLQTIEQTDVDWRLKQGFGGSTADYSADVD